MVVEHIGTYYPAIREGFLNPETRGAISSVQQQVFTLPTIDNIPGILKKGHRKSQLVEKYHLRLSLHNDSLTQRHGKAST